MVHFVDDFLFLPELRCPVTEEEVSAKLAALKVNCCFTGRGQRVSNQPELSERLSLAYIKKKRRISVCRGRLHESL